FLPRSSSSTLRRPPTSTLFPYTTLFRSELGIYPRDPFVNLDTEGVGELVRIAAERGRATRPDLKLGICGEHGGDPASIAFCEERSEEHTSELQSRENLVCRLLLEKKKDQ